MFLMLLGLGCKQKLLDQYEQERLSVLSKATAAPEDWSPDLQLQLSYTSLSEIGKSLLVDSLGHGQVSRDILGQTVKIKLTNSIEHFELSKSIILSFVTL